MLKRKSFSKRKGPLQAGDFTPGTGVGISRQNRDGSGATELHAGSVTPERKAKVVEIANLRQLEKPNGMCAEEFGRKGNRVQNRTSGELLPLSRGARSMDFDRRCSDVPSVLPRPGGPERVNAGDPSSVRAPTDFRMGRSRHINWTDRRFRDAGSGETGICPEPKGPEGNFAPAGGCLDTESPGQTTIIKGKEILQ